jgi:uncharacterized protein YgiM (DUF1202 family)
MGIAVALWILLFLVPTEAFGQSLYVGCQQKVRLRTDTNLDSKIVAVLETGQEMTLVRKEGNYYLVALSNGKQGYIFKDYVTEQTPEIIQLRELEQQLQQKIESAAEARTLVQQGELIVLREELNKLQADKQRAADEAKKQATEFQARQNAFERDTQLRWFIIGASVFLAGIIFDRIWAVTQQRNQRTKLRL